MTSAPEVSRQTAFLALQMLLLNCGATLNTPESGKLVTGSEGAP